MLHGDPSIVFFRPYGIGNRLFHHRGRRRAFPNEVTLHWAGMINKYGYGLL